MIFILNKQEKVINILKNDEGNKSNSFYDDLLTEDLTTGAETYSFSTIAKGSLSKDLVIGNYIAFKKEGKYKLFQIVQVTSTHEEEMEISVYSECAGLLLTNNVYRSRKIPSATFRKFLESVVEGTDWNVGYIDVRLLENTIDLDLEDSTCYAALENNLSKFGAEIEFRVEINNGGISQKYIDAYVERGKRTGKIFTFGRDIEGITKSIDSTDLCTALIGRGKNGLTFRDITISGIDKPLGQDFVADQTAYELYNRNGSHLTGIYEYDTESAEDLLRATYKKLQEVKEPKATYEIPVLLLGDLLDRDWEKVRIGDYIGISDNSFNPPLHLMARVSKLETSFTNPQDDKCTLSNFVEVNSNITNEMRKIASQLEGYVDNKFPIGSEDIQSGAVNGDHMDKTYMSQLSADIVKASLVEADRIITNEIQAVEGRFQNILTDNISAINGRFDKVETDVLNANKVIAELGEFDSIISNRVTANEGSISDLNSNLIKANEVIVGLGKFDTIISNRVDAAEGNITILNTNVGKIETLISGNISSENIQTGGITGDNLNMDTVFIEDANILNVNASKINTGEINTNKVHIQSENGGIVIADNTQQFKDKNNKVRVQIGQDATGEFSFGVFDETGTGVLIDATGVKDKALADGIIKDRMIGQGEIGGNKIDINSLITEVNKDTNTSSIKGSKILLDTQGQKLDVAFNSLKNQADETKSQTESNTTQIGVEQGRINTLIQDTTIVKDGESLKLKDAYNKTVQTVDSLKTTVGQHETKWSENENFVSSVNSTLEQHTNAIKLKVESSYVEEVFEKTIKSVDVQYYLSTSSSSLVGGSWVTTAPQWEKGKFIWTKTITTYMSGLMQETTPVCISGVNGQDGQDGTNGVDGKGVKSIIEEYYLSTSSTALSGGSWSTTVPTWVNGKYMWTRSVITYTDNSTTITNPVCVSGSKGDKGDTGIGISSVDVEYYLSTSSTALSGGSWSTTTPTWADGKYMWSRTKTVKTNGTTTYSNPVCITGGKGTTGNTGAKGDTGATGQGISSITEEYYLSTSKTTQTGGSWVTTPPTWSNGKYVWTRSKIVYKNPTATTYTTPICDSSWEAANEIQIGGRNLLMNSSLEEINFPYTSTKYNWRTASISDSSTLNRSRVLISDCPTFPNGIYGIKFVNTGTTNASVDIAQDGRVMEHGETYTLSAYFKVTKGNPKFALQYGTTPYPAKTFESSTTWVKHSFTFTYDATQFSNKNTTNIYFGIRGNSFEGYVCGFKLEKGNKSSDWTPAPEDVDDTISTIDTKVEKTNNRVATIETDLSSITQRVSSTESTINTHTTQLGTVNSRINTAKNSAISTASTDATNKSNSALTSAKSYTDGQITTVNKTITDKVAEIKTTTDGITSRVSKAESNITTANNNISSLTSRISSAEQKITDSAIISTVRSTINTAKNEAISSANTNTANQLKNYATTSSLTQTASSIEAKFSSSGGYNLLKNSAFANKQIDNWWVWGGVSRWTTESYYKEVGDMYIANPNTNNPGGLWQSEIPIKPNTKYTLSVACYKEGNVKGGWFGLEYQSSPDSSVITYQNIELTFDDKRHSYTFTTPNNSAIKYAKVGFRHEGAITTGGGYLIKINKPCLAEGEVSVWSPNPFEIKDGSTMIDASGVTIKNGALKVQNNAGQTVLSGDSNGNLNLTSIGSGLTTNISSGSLVLNNTSTGAHMDLQGTTIKLYDYSTIDERAEISKSVGKLTISSWSQKEVPSIDLNTDTVNIPNKLSMGGALVYKGNTILNGYDTWLRTYGDNGWYNETYCGGWYMTDYNWIRAYNGKNIYTSGSIKTDGNAEIGGYMICNKLTVGNQNPNDMTFNAPWYGLGRTNYTCGGTGAAVQLAGYWGLTLRSRDSIVELRADGYTLEKGHFCPFDSRSYWLGTNTPDRQWKGLCAEGGTVGASDIRAKENIERLDGTIVSYDEVSEELKEYQLATFKANTRATESDYYEFIRDRFKPSYYNYKLSEQVNEETGEYTISPEDEYNMLKNVGFIAQDYDLETDKVAQEFIFKNEDGSLSYNHMSYVTVGMIALQEATRKIDALEKENAQLKEDLEKIKQHLGIS